VQFEGGADGAQRVVLVRHWVAEDRHHGVAEQSVDSAVIPRDDLAGTIPDLVYDVAHILRV